jgi:hypothetical protein
MSRQRLFVRCLKIGHTTSGRRAHRQPQGGTRCLGHSWPCALGLCGNWRLALRRGDRGDAPRELELGLAIILGPSALFVIGTFFFLSGLLAPRSIARHGPAGFVRQRMLRLGIPWLLFTILVWPLVTWVAYRSAGHTLSFWQVLQARQPFLDSGPLWFVQILLYVSVGHALSHGSASTTAYARCLPRSS